MSTNGFRYGTAAAAALLLTGFATAIAAADPDASSCPAVYALGVQGTGESSPDAAPTTDTGMLSTVFTPFMAAAQTAGVAVDRAYIPYDASFGGMGPSTATTNYETSVNDGLTALTSKVSQVTASCPSTYLALTGYSQGAHVVSMLAQKIGAGSGPIPASKIAGVALFGDPTRNRSASVFPGAPDRTTPEPVPGTSGGAVGAVAAVNDMSAQGSGIGPQRDIAVSFGDLTGRVASFCSPGDLSCDAPDNAALLRTVANVAGQVEIGNDPIKSLASITQALGLTAIKAATNVINSNITGTSLASLSLNPGKSISASLAEASDPRTEVDPTDVLKAVLKVGTIAINAISTVVKTVLNPASIAEIATAGLANPVAGLAVLGTKLLSAVPELIPPATASRLIQSTFTEVVNDVKDNTDLLDVGTWTKYSDVLLRHGSYQHDSISGDGKSATNWVGEWFAAAASDVSGLVPAATKSAPTSGNPSAPTTSVVPSVTAAPTPGPSDSSAGGATTGESN
ncbi:cutinase family protein [Nocardia sp. NBC_01327]|uniref:cutinase family protein n=1 Tax=Nocardia sp. NBC_01327 TaxID=2903593 RepID=UPI002E0D7D8E|nr:cutinase family protein [Nocardia sp. NBC_01327]